MFKKILVPIDIDYPQTAAAVYKKVEAIARLSNAEIKLVSVMPGFGMPIVASFIPEDVQKEAADRFKKALEDFVRDNCHESVTFEIRTGKNWEGVLRTAENWGADLIVVYHNRRKEFNEMFSGSCSQRVADHAKCSVLRLRNVMP